MLQFPLESTPDSSFPEAATSIIFVTTNVLSWQTCLLSWQKYDCHDKTFSWQNYVYHDKHTFPATKDSFCHDKRVCHDKSKLVTTKRLSQQNYICCDKYLLQQVFSWQKCLSWQKFCHDKHTFVMTRHVLSQQMFLSWQNFCRNKNTCGSSRQWQCTATEAQLNTSQITVTRAYRVGSIDDLDHVLDLNVVVLWVERHGMSSVPLPGHALWLDRHHLPRIGHRCHDIGTGTGWQSSQRQASDNDLTKSIGHSDQKCRLLDALRPDQTLNLISNTMRLIGPQSGRFLIHWDLTRPQSVHFLTQ